jgi:hypothetical protein
MDTFRLEVSTKADRLDLDALPDHEKNVLLAGIKFDPSTHDIYRFCVAPKFDLPEKGTKRARKRKSYSLADTVCVQVIPRSEEIHILNIYPETTTAAGQPDAPSFQIPIVRDLRPASKAKDLARRGKHMVVANRTDTLAEWVFLKSYIDAGHQFRMQVLCIVPKAVPDHQRYLRCDASVMHKGRELQGARARSVFLPPLGVSPG